MVGTEGSRGDREREFRELICSETYSWLWRKAAWLTRCREDAEDLLQGTLAAAYESIHRLKDVSKGRAWLLRILRNGFLNHVRGNKRREHHEGVVRSAGLKSPETSRGEVQDFVVGALYCLSPDDRWLLTMHYIEDATTGDLAESLRTSEANIRQRLSRARRKLKAEFGKLQREHGLRYGQ